MFTALLESGAPRQRRRGGVALSVIAHLVVIGGATAATASGRSVARKEPPVIYTLHAPPPVAKPTEARHAAPPTGPAPTSPSPVVIHTVIAPTTVPAALPPVLAESVAADSIVIGGSRGTTSGLGGGILDGASQSPSPDDWRGNDLLMRITSSARPRYPESLRQAGIAGRVLVRFTVDTLGVVDPASVQILESTHDLFSRAVREVLPSFRFKPSESHGHRVPALAEMPFEFSIAR